MKEPSTSELEAALRRVFVEHQADYIVISSRREQFQIEAAAYGEEQGWIKGQWDNRDVQNTVWIGRLTDEGRKHFGLEAKKA